MNNPNDVKDNEMLENHESNKSVTNHKIKMTVLISLNAVLLIALLIVATFTWIPSTIIEADRINYTNDLIVSSLDIDLELYVFDQNVYDENVQSYGKYVEIARFYHDQNNNIVSSSQFENVLMRLNPGDKMSYQIKITNRSQATSMIADMLLEDFYAIYDPHVHYVPSGEEEDPEEVHPNNEDIFDYLSINIVSPEVSEIPKLSEGFTLSYTNKKNLLFYDNLTILQGETVYINWYIELSAEADNQFWGTEIGFKHIFFGI